jgi:hypothetical protein
MATTTPNYDINYEDERFQTVSTEKDAAISDMENTYQGMIDQSDRYYQNLQQNAQNWADKQSQLQQEQTDFTIEQIEQQKDQAHKDYLKEQSGAYQDWQKQSNQYGVNAEQMAAQGMVGTGFSESSQVSMYNTYQNRVATSREVYNRAVLNYDNNIKEARLQNNAILAEIAYQALQTQMELALEGFQYKNSLITEQMNKKIELDNIYYNRWQDVLTQMNTENAMKEEIRQFAENQKFQAAENEKNRQFEAAENKLDRDFQAKQKELDRSFEEKMAAINRQHDKDMLAAKTKAEKELLEEQHKKDMAKLAQQQKYEKELLAQKLANEKALLKEQYSYKSSSSSGGGSSSINKGTSGSSSSSSSSINKGTGSGSSSSSKPKVDQSSVMALGRGPLSEKQLADLVASGQIKAIQKGNTIVFENVGNKGVAAGQALLDKYNWTAKANSGTSTSTSTSKGGKNSVSNKKYLMY